MHGLGINPKDGALFVATHTGLFRAAANERRSARVADRFQDTMGFTVVGPDRFLGSGHPDGRERLPPFLGLIESRDAGESWKPVSLLGEQDFHVLEAQGPRVYGFGSNFKTREATLLTSRDGGRSWQERTPLEPLRRVGQAGGQPAAFEAVGRDELYVALHDGTIMRSTDGGASWSIRSAP